VPFATVLSGGSQTSAKELVELAGSFAGRGVDATVGLGIV
jgi:hypothetical protein